MPLHEEANETSAHKCVCSCREHLESQVSRYQRELYMVIGRGSDANYAVQFLIGRVVNQNEHGTSGKRARRKLASIIVNNSSCTSSGHGTPSCSASLPTKICRPDK